ncbi:phosphoprotein [Vesiculovirus malpais]|uniref:Phosphoprotein n=1 Tax=Vesiculovirus malpais TaxID=1972570 RepID=M4VQS6_9RHAB|nr:phosphoprotein [Vesiculovirus malpais]AGI04015.1 phosphoprotein [Vesiculovirus malpais]
MSKIVELLKNYPNIMNTMEDIESLEGEVNPKAASVVPGSSKEEPTPSYFLADMLPEEEGEDPKGGVEAGEEEGSTAGDYDDYAVQFEDREWVAGTEISHDGTKHYVITNPVKSNRELTKKWTAGIVGLLKHIEEGAGIKINCEEVEQGIKCQMVTSCPPHDANDTSSSSGDSETCSSPTSDKSKNSTTISSVPDFDHPSIIDLIDRDITLPSLDDSKPGFVLQLPRLFGSREAAINCCKEGEVSIKSAVVAGLRRKGIYNKIRIKFDLDKIQF